MSIDLKQFQFLYDILSTAYNLQKYEIRLLKRVYLIERFPLS